MPLVYLSPVNTIYAVELEDERLAFLASSCVSGCHWVVPGCNGYNVGPSAQFRRCEHHNCQYTSYDITINGNCTLREAIITANTDLAVDACHAGSGADVIDLPAGTYTLNLAGGLAISDDLTINGAGQGTTIIDGNNIDRIFEILQPAVVVIEGVTVQNGQVNGNGGGILNRSILTISNSVISGNTASVVGGGVTSFDGELTIENSVISDNHAPTGGGIFSENTLLKISSSTIDLNTAQEVASEGDDGGGVYNSNNGTAEITDTIISNNVAGHNGGGIHNRGKMTISKVTVELNIAQDFSGGGIANHLIGELNILNSVIRDNTTGNSGGGITNTGTITISDNSIVSGNVASNDGGGVHVTPEGVVEITDSSISNNTAQGNGGGIDNVGIVEITNSNISTNTASIRGGGIFNRDGGSLDITNAVFTMNHADGRGAGIYNGSVLAVTSGTFTGNIAGEDGGAIYISRSGTVTITDTNIDGNLVGDDGGGILNRGMLTTTNSARGTFIEVPDGSAIMSPSNRTNPDTTEADGAFGWDVIAGFYKVRAEATGCVSPFDLSQTFVETGVLTIPPPVTNLALVLECRITAEPSFTLYQDTTDAATGLKLDITRVYDPSTSNEMAILFDDFTAQLTYDGGRFNVLGVRDLDFSVDINDLQINNDAGETTMQGASALLQDAPSDLSHVLSRLVGNNQAACAVDLEIIVLTGDNGVSIPFVPPSLTQNLLRGDARVDGNVTIADALFIAQYLVGSRTACTTAVSNTCLHSVNAASVRHDEEFDKKTIADALFIAQHLVGLRDENYILVP